ncbi:MAG TPA: enoyl-CoA hydratase/isomerase family protein [Candidatus Sulfotelmatobacter sp.]|jgi:enoyl-CoA hydratase/carnithine racemase|nr:enoyl-CoA hydratase/isomerase family protein [Candidatus Sulfotelmatobacter sp.]
MAYQKLKVDTQGGIAWIRLSDPPANTYSYAMMRELDEAILEARMDETVHVIVLRGEGEKFFCAGADIAMLTQAKPAFKYYFCLHANETLNRLEQTPKVVIAALNGHCVGGGLEVALAADLRVAKRGGGKIGLPEVSLGVLPGTGGTQRLSRALGRSKAFELMATARTFEADEAKALGLVHEVFDADEFDPKTKAYAESFLPPSRAAKAVGLIKRAVVSGLEAGFSEGLAIERELQQRLFESDDAREGLAAYVERRPPKFTGR